MNGVYFVINGFSLWFDNRCLTYQSCFFTIQAKNLLFLQKSVIFGNSFLYYKQLLMKNIYVLCLLCLPFFLFSQTKNNAQARFVQNKGQWDLPIAYMQRLSNGHIGIQTQGFSIMLLNGETAHSHEKQHDKTHEVPTKGHFLQISFLGANPNVIVEGKEKLEEYSNFYLGNEPAKWQTQVPIFTQIQHKNLYGNSINMTTEVVEEHFKYTFEIAPNGDPSQIQVLYEGADNLFIDKEGNLNIETSVGLVKELQPIVFQYDEDGKKLSVACEFALKNKIISFIFPKGYDHNKTLFLDPTVIFSTYTGSTQDNWGFTATYDNQGNAYGGGMLYNGGWVGATGYPTTAGAFQTGYMGGAWDATIIKYNPTGTSPIFSTYLGGQYADQVHSLVVDANDNLFAYGRTSSHNFPVSAGCYDNSRAGAMDMYITKFSPTGTMLASTFLGGNGDDGVNGDTVENILQLPLEYNYGDDARGEIITDDLGNVYIAAVTKSTDFPIVGGFQTTYGGGYTDGVVAKLDNNLTTLLWSSYLGGSAADAAYGIQIDNLYQAYITGGTASTNFPTTAGSLSPNSNGGIADGFITKINSTGNSLLASTYIGTSAYDQSHFIQLDNSYNVYVYGQSLGAFPVSGGVYSVANSRQFIAKLDNNLAGILLSTRFGTGASTYPNISPTAFLVDICENVYVSGWGGAVFGYNPYNSGTSGLAVTGNATQATTDGHDFYLMALTPNMTSLQYATFWGGLGGAIEHVDGGTCRFDKNGVIYHAVCAGCGGSSAFPTTPGVWSTTNNSSNCNLAVFKIDFGLAGINANFNPLDSVGNIINVTTTGCAPLTIDFQNLSTGTNAATTTYSWDFGVTPTATSNMFEPSFTYTTAGTYTVTLIINDPSNCFPIDTAFKTIIVYPPPALDAGPAQVLCPGQTANLNATGVGAFVWTPSATLSDDSISNPIANPLSTTTYTVTLTDNNGCSASDTMSVVRSNIMDVNAGNDVAICPGASTTLGASSTQGGVTYSWYPNTGLSNININNPVATPPATQLYYVYAQNPSGCFAIDSVLISVQNVINVFAGNDTFLCRGGSVQLNATITGAANPVFSWTPSTGLSNTSVPNPTVTISANQSYVLYATDFGCIDSDTILVQIFQVDFGNGATIEGCSGDTIQLQLNINNAASYNWFPSTYLNNPNIANPIAIPTASITYNVEIVSPVGCRDTGQITLNIHPLPTANAGADIYVCIGDSKPLQGTGGTIYSWSPATALSDPNSDAPFTNPTDTTLYILTVTDNFGCKDKDSMQVNVLNLPTITSGAPYNICDDDTIQLSVVGATSYVWNENNTLSNLNVPNPFAYPSITTTYIVVGTDDYGCKNDTTVTVTVTPLPPTNIEGNPSICKGETVFLTANGGQSYVWSTGDSTQGISFQPQSSGFIYCTASANGCKGRMDSVFVNVYEVEAVADFTADPDSGFAPMTVHFTNLSQNGYKFYWEFGSMLDNSLSTSRETNPTAMYPRAGHFKAMLVAYDSHFCTDTAYKYIFAENPTVYVPSVFTPNGDVSNEYFTVGYYGVRNFHIDIYSRWGTLMYSSDNKDFQWDGKYKNAPSPEGVYTWVVTGTWENNVPFKKVGTVTIVR